MNATTPKARWRQVLATDLNFQWLGNAFAHLMRLPLSFFEKRHVGHIVSCFGSVNAIQKTLKEPDTVDKMKKQNFNIVPSKSLADAKTWLAGEMKHWEGITSVVKIDLGAQ